MSRYVPPALRRATEKAASNETSSEEQAAEQKTKILHSGNDIRRHYWPGWEPSPDPRKSSLIRKENAHPQSSWGPARDNNATADKDASVTNTGHVDQDKLLNKEATITTSQTAEEDGHSPGATYLGHYGTLNDSAADPGSLVYLMLFKDANPRWEQEKTIFVHTNIRLLPDVPKSAREAWQELVTERKQNGATFA
jgi:hypothetical protein